MATDPFHAHQAAKAAARRLERRLPGRSHRIADESADDRAERRRAELALALACWRASILTEPARGAR
jgi:hypothetical protein